MSNGHENPVVDELLKLYKKIKYMYKFDNEKIKNENT